MDTLLAILTAIPPEGWAAIVVVIAAAFGLSKAQQRRLASIARAAAEAARVAHPEDEEAAHRHATLSLLGKHHSVAALRARRALDELRERDEIADSVKPTRPDDDPSGQALVPGPPHPPSVRPGPLSRGRKRGL